VYVCKGGGRGSDLSYLQVLFVQTFIYCLYTGCHKIQVVKEKIMRRNFIVKPEMKIIIFPSKIKNYCFCCHPVFTKLTFDLGHFKQRLR